MNPLASSHYHLHSLCTMIWFLATSGRIDNRYHLFEILNISRQGIKIIKEIVGLAFEFVKKIN